MITEKIIKNFSIFYEKGEITDDQAIDICQCIFDYLNPMPVSEYAKANGKTRQTLYANSKQIKNILGRKYILNNN